MPDCHAPAQSLPVFNGAAFRVQSGANLGDGLSFAADMVLDDVYRLEPGAEAARMALRPDADHFVIDPATEVGTSGASLCLDSALALMTPDGQTTDVLVMVELDPTGHVAQSYLLPLATIKPKTDYALVGINTETARETLARIACVSFTRGTHITMSDGRQSPIEDLAVGDRVLTRDAGVQAIRWIGQSTVRAAGAFAPICISAGALNNERDLIVSPDHRLFIYQRSDRIGAGRSELLVKARHLVNGDSVTVLNGGFVDYFQLLFDTHQIIFAEGIAAESFLIDARTAPAVPEDLTERLALQDKAGTRSLSGLDVNEALLDRPDATELLRRASAT